jgi:hypothetical protein
MSKVTLFLKFLLCGILLGASCDENKEYHTIVRGKVINVGSKAPIDSVLVVIRDGIPSGGGWFDLGNTSSDKKSYTYTDKNGFFEIELIGEHSAYLGLSKKGYLYEFNEGGSVIGYKYFSNRVFENEILEMKADAWFKPILKSKEISHNTDTLFFEILSNHRSEYDIIHGNPYGITGFHCEFYGIGPFTYSYRSIGDTYLPFRIALKRQSIKTIRIDSVYIKSFDTYADTIYY